MSDATTAIDRGPDHRDFSPSRHCTRAGSIPVRDNSGTRAFALRQLSMPKTAESWSLTSLREKLIKIGAKVVRHGRYVTFQMAEVAVSRQMFADILSLIARLRAPPAPA
jgi:hypothetical protein